MYSFIIFFTFIGARVCISIIEDIYLQDNLFLQKNNTKATFYIQISNLFNQRDVRGDGDFSSIYGPGEFIRWGMESPRPDNKQFQDYGDFYANTRYHGSPREIQVGIRTSF